MGHLGGRGEPWGCCGPNGKREHISVSHTHTYTHTHTHIHTHTYTHTHTHTHAHTHTHIYTHTHAHTHIHTHARTHRTTTYIDQMNAWYDKKTTQELVNLKLWEQLKDAVDVFGLSAVDRLFSFMIVQELQTFLKYLTRFLLRPGGPFLKLMATFGQELSNPERLIGERGVAVM